MAISEPDVWVVANLKETQMEKVRVGQPVAIRIDSFPHQKFRGWVDSVQPGTGATYSLLPPDNATGNFIKIVQRVPVKIVFDPDSFVMAFSECFLVMAIVILSGSVAILLCRKAKSAGDAAAG